MLNAYEVTVTYKLYALNEDDALTLALLKRVEPETIDISDLPVQPTPEVVIPNF